MALLPDFSFDFDVNKLLGDFKAPGVDVDALITTQRKNIDALTAANRTVLEGLQAVFQRQADILRTSISEATEAAQKIASAASPQEGAIRQTELVKDAFERALSNSRELSDIIARSNSEAAELLSRRFVQLLDELKDGIAKTK